MKQDAPVSVFWTFTISAVSVKVGGRHNVQMQLVPAIIVGRNRAWDVLLRASTSRVGLLFVPSYKTIGKKTSDALNDEYGKFED